MKGCHLTKEDYEEVKDRLSMSQVAAAYGYPPGRRGVCRCPFHEDLHPSLQLYEKGFYCFSCGVGGDPIKFTGKLFGLRNEQAAKKLIADFGLPVTEPESYREKREREKLERKRRELDFWKKHSLAVLGMYYQLLCDASRDPEGEHFTEALQELTMTEYRLECLKECPEAVFADRKAVRRIGDIERRIAGWHGGIEPERTGPG